jgi:nucleoside-diphosphate-sugar epimerase
MTTRNILVTGGGGFLGSAIVRVLHDRGDRVVSFSRRRHTALAALGIAQIQGDLGDKSALTEACRGMDVVFHAAAKAGIWGRYRDFHATNCLGTGNLVAACLAAGVGVLVHTSSPSVVFDGGDMEGVDESAPYPQRYLAAYPQTKALAERMVVAAAGDDMRAIVLRPHLIWGPGDNHLVPRILKRARRLRQIGDGSNLVDTVYIDNAAHAHILAADALLDSDRLCGRIYFISQGKPVRLWAMVNAILAAGAQGPVEGKLHPGVAYLAGWFCEAVYRGLRLSSEPPMTRFLAKELATSHWFDIGAVRRDLGYEAAVSSEEGLVRLSRWLGNGECAHRAIARLGA